MVSPLMPSRFVIKALLYGIILAFATAGVVGVKADQYNDEINTAINVATVSLQREMNSLQEQLELFEMKHETLQAASEQFRIQSKNAKKKLEEERNRYDILASEKRSLETSIENKLAMALEDQKATFEDSIATEHVKKTNSLTKENEELSKKLRRTEYQVSMLEDSMKEKLQEQSKRYEISEGKRLASEQKLRTEISGLVKRLSYAEKQSKSFEESWKNAVAESEAKDDYFQEESGKHLDEASRWEQRLQKLSTESQVLFEENKSKEVELIRSKKIHMTLLDKLQTSDELVKKHESEIESYIADIEKLSGDLESASTGLTQTKKDHKALVEKFENLRNVHQDTEHILESVRTEGERNAAKNIELQNEVVDIKFELESSQNKTKQTIEEKAEMTKAYTEALEQLTSKNNLLRYELVDLKFELEQSKNASEVLRKQIFDVTNAHKKALEKLEIEGNKLTILQVEFSGLKRDYEIMTEQFNESKENTKMFQQRVEEETRINEKIRKDLLYAELQVQNSHANEMELRGKNGELLQMYEELQIELENSEAKLLESKQQHQKSKDEVERQEGSLLEFEVRIKELIKELELKDAKNSYLQKSLLDARYSLEDSQAKVNLLEAQITERSTVDQDVGVLEIENKRMMERAQALERELKESSSLYNGANREISDLRDQLNATEARSAAILSKYELMKEENDALSRDLRESEEHKHEVYSTNLELTEKSETFERCNKDLLETQSEYSKLLREYDNAKEKIGETEKKIQRQEYTIKELKTRQTESEITPTNPETEKEQLEVYERESVGETENIESDTKDEHAMSSESMKANDFQTTSTQDEREPRKRPRKSFFSFFRWLDYALYKILRVIVDLTGLLANNMWHMLSSSTFIVQFTTPIRSMLAIVSWALNELRIIHDALISLFEFEMTFVSSLVSSEKDRTAFLFLIRHSKTIVMFGEAIAFMLCIDFIVSSFLNPIRARKRRPKAKTIRVPKTANASLLRKANNM